MSLPTVENLSGLQESIVSLSRGPQLHFGEKSKNMLNFIKFIDFPLSPLFGVHWAAVISYFPKLGQMRVHIVLSAVKEPIAASVL